MRFFQRSIHSSMCGSGVGKALGLAIVVVASLLSVLCFASPTFAQELNFDQGRTFATNRAMSSMALGDIDGDGDLDIVSSGKMSQTNLIYLNDGVGNFIWEGSTRRFGDEQGQTWDVAVGDVDGDGDLDIVAGNRQQQSAIYLNDGAGHFDWPGSSRKFGAAEDYTSAVALGDVDGDGDLDIVAGNILPHFSDGPGQSNTLYRNDGRGNFDRNDSVQVFGEPMTAVTDIVLGDINKDGHLDIIVAQSTSDPDMIYLNDGHGNFGWQNGSYYFNDEQSNVALGDLDGNGYLDLLSPQGARYYMFYLSEAAGTVAGNAPQWQSRRIGLELENDKLLGTYGVAVGDMDGDGSPDLVTGTNKKNAIYLNDGSGHFDAERSIPYGAGKSQTTIVLLGDLNGDGFLDIVNYTNQRGIVYFNNGGGSFSNENPTNFGSQIYDIAVGDMNADGYLDVVTGNWRGQNQVFRNDGTGRFDNADAALPFGTREDQTYSIAVGDMNGDRHLDIVTSNTGEQNMVYLNDGANHFNTVGYTRTFGTGHDATFAVATGDMDNDGDLDIVAGNFTKQSAVYLNDGAGNFGWAGSVRPFSVNYTRTVSIAVGDVDRDGDLDIVAGNSEQPSVVYLNDGNGNFDWAGSAHPISVNSYGTFSVALGDMNGDGALDIVAGNNTQHVYYVETNGKGNIDFANGSANDQSLIYLNDGAGNFSEEHVSRFGSLSHETYDVALGDIDGDGDIDIITGNSQSTYEDPEQSNTVYLNDGIGNFSVYNSRILQRGEVNLRRPKIAVGDMDRDGDLDIVTAGESGTGLLYLNHLKPGKRWSSSGNSIAYEVNQAPYVTIQPNIAAVDANFYASPEILANRMFPITYTLFDREADLVGRIAVSYSLDGGGHWQPALAFTNTKTMALAASPTGVTHVFAWDTLGTDIFGQSDNVVVRLAAYTQPAQSAPVGAYRYTDTIPGPYLWPYVATSTFPFGVRGTQVRVVDETNYPKANALVSHLSKQRSAAGQFFDLPRRLSNTSPEGYLRGRGTFMPGEQLIALAPITSTNFYTLYYTSATPILNGLATFTVTHSGVQTLTVSAANPLILFNLKVALEWDARNDPIYMGQLRANLLRASEILYDWSNGQAALGNITVYHDRQHWGDANIRIQVSNRLRPNSDQGGIVTEPITETVMALRASSSITDVLTYVPGQVRMPVVWNRFGDPGIGDLGEDWPRTLAHELGHYLFFLYDNYLGFDKDQQLISVEDCPGAMSDQYSASAADDEFDPAVGWPPASCVQSLSHQMAGRADWATIQRYYPWLLPPTVAITDTHYPTGPNILPLAVTQVTFVDHTPMTSTTALAVPFFNLLDEAGHPYYPGNQARAFLFSTQARAAAARLIDLGRPTGNLLKAWGIKPEQRLCVFDLENQHTGCTSGASADNQLTLQPTADQEQNKSLWEPAILITPISSRTIEISVTVGITPAIPQLMARLYSVEDESPLTNTITLTRTGTITDMALGLFSGTFHVSPTIQAYIDLWVEGDSAPFVRETVVDYAIGGSPGKRRGRWWASYSAGDRSYSYRFYRRHFGAPVLSRDGQATLWGKDFDEFPPGEFYAIQTTSLIPNPPPWVTVVGQGYRLIKSRNAPMMKNASLSLTYLAGDVPPGEEQWLTIYRYAEGSDCRSNCWTPLQGTKRQTETNTLVAPVSEPGLYALMSSTEITLTSPGWNLIGYPIHETRPVSAALAAIANNYSAVYGYDATDEADPWQVFIPGAPSATNDLTELTFGQGYLIDVSPTGPPLPPASQAVTQSITLRLRGSLGATTAEHLTGQETGSAPMNLLFHPLPAVYYGEITDFLAQSDAITPTAATVTAYIDGRPCAEGKTWQEEEGVLRYLIKIPAADAAHSGCGAPGKTITFSVGDRLMATTAPWNSSQVQELLLTTVPTYIVRRGDTLSSIALRFETTVSALVKANHLYDPDYLRVGQRLQIPR